LKFHQALVACGDKYLRIFHCLCTQRKKYTPKLALSDIELPLVMRRFSPFDLIPQWVRKEVVLGLSSL